MLKQRIITALILGPIVLAIVIMGSPKWFMLLTATIQLASTYEWLNMHRLSMLPAFIVATLVTLASCYFAHVLMVAQGGYTAYLLMVFCLVWLLALFWLWRFKLGRDNTHFQLVLKSTIGVLAIALFAMAFLLIRVQPQGHLWALILLLTIWVADIGAYFSGKNLGKHKLAINISPGKTWEGVVGAQLAVLLFAIVIAQMMPITWQHAIWLFPLVALFSVVGDLTASLGKRQAGVKDSSQLLPGHGGFIDRFDSLIAAAPLYLFLLNSL